MNESSSGWAGLYLFFVVMSSMMLLTSCSHVTVKDGPPKYYVDETRIPNAIPKPEPLAKRGTASYVALGKRYYPMRSSKNYSAVGLASWYGTKFHNRHTSSGERYDLLGMTAAHKTLPLPTYVKVTNLNNHREIIVKVNDRGPFSGSRLIDLSYVAAKKLGMLGHGTALVKVSAIDPYTYGKHIPVHSYGRHVPTTIPHSSSIYLQVGAFRKRSNAQQLKHKLSTVLNAPVYIAQPSFNSRLFRVKVGPLNGFSDASKVTNHLKKLGIPSNRVPGG